MRATSIFPPLQEKRKQANKENKPEHSKVALKRKKSGLPEDVPDEGPEAAKKVCVAVSLLAMHDLKAMKVTIEYCWMIVSHSDFCMLKLYMRSHSMFDMLQHSLQLATALQGTTNMHL